LEEHMDSPEYFRERFEALEQLTRQLQNQSHALEAHTRTVERRLRRWRRIAQAVLVLSLLSWTSPPGKAQGEQGLENRITVLEDKLAVVTFNASTGELTITGANLRLVNGLGATDTINGLGNLIVGYNEERAHPSPNLRTGSHNVIVGGQNNFSSFGGLVVGRFNSISGPFASVSGGTVNTAGGSFTAISGGTMNTTSGFFTSVSGGVQNTASGAQSSVSGGENNMASGTSSSISGGANNIASGQLASISGGFRSTASGAAASISGGLQNLAGGDFSSVSGGSNRPASHGSNWVAGGLFQPN
jgi:hypothetical protein